MKKQIAVMMAAATAVTTVAPVIAHADTYDNFSISRIVDDVREKLGKHYEGDGDGLGNNTVSHGSYLNSKYAVLVSFDGNMKNEPAKYGFNTLAESPYKDAFVLDDYTNRTWYVVDNANKLDELLEKASKVNTIEENDPIVSIISKGDNNTATKVAEYQYLVQGKLNGGTEGESMTLNTLAQKFADMGIKDRDGKVSLVKELKIFYTDNTEYKINKDKPEGELDLTNKTVSKIEVKTNKDITLTYVENSYVPNLTKGLDGDKEIDLIGKNTNDQSVLNDITGFKNLGFTKENPNKIIGLTYGDVNYYKIVNVKPAVINMGLIYTHKDGYTKEGAKFVNTLITAAKNGGKFNYDGVNYKVINKGETAKESIQKAADNAKITKLADGTYEVKVEVYVENANDTEVKRTLQFIFNAKTQNDVDDVLRDIRQFNEVVVGKFAKLAGDNRYETAIKVSEEQFGIHEAKSIVVVGGEAVFDGLAAAPLAASVKAPILLSHPKSGLNNATIDEIKRACDDLNHKTVYIVGGTNSVPSKTVKQLEDLGAVVVRLSGATRMETSEQVARKMMSNNKTNNRVFFVGYNGAADAMSISGVAAYGYNKDNSFDQVVTGKYGQQEVDKSKLYSPIVVVKKGHISQEARDILSNVGPKHKTAAGKSMNEAILIGGSNTIDNQAYLDAQLVVGKDNVSRISGDNRYDTNVEVVKTFYGNSENYPKESAVNNYKDTLNIKEKELKALKDQKKVDDAEKAYNDAVTEKNAAEAALNTANETKTNATKKVTETKDAMLQAENNYNELNSKEPKASGDEIKAAESKLDDARTLYNSAVAKENEAKAAVEAAQKNLETAQKNEEAAKVELGKVKAETGKTANLDNATTVKTDIANLENEIESLKNEVKIDKILVNGAIFASGKDKYLVDAQTAGSFSADKRLPIILTAEKLSAKQKGLMEGSGALLSGQRTNIYQVGGVVTSDVMSEVVKALNL